MGTSQIPPSALSEGSVKSRTRLPVGFSEGSGEARRYEEGRGLARNRVFLGLTLLDSLLPRSSTWRFFKEYSQQVKAPRGWVEDARMHEAPGFTHSMHNMSCGGVQL